MNDVLGPHNMKQDKMEEFERKLHDDGILMKVET